MKAGRLDRRVTFRRKTTKPNEFGEEVETWCDWLTVWAGKTEPRGTETVDGGEVRAAHADIWLRVRHMPDPPTPLDRMMIDGREYDIQAVREIGRRVGHEIDGTTRADG